MYARVIVDISHTNVDRVYDYRIPAGLAIQAGMRVSVPFGAKTVEGFVIGLSEETDFDDTKIKELIRPLEDFPALTGGQLALAGYMKERYNITLAHALRFMIPAQLRGGRVNIKTRNHCRLILEGGELQKAKLALYTREGKPKSPRQIEVMERLEGTDGGLPAAMFAASAVRALEKKGIISVAGEEVERLPFDKRIDLIEDYPLTDGQQRVLNEIFAEKENKRFLLHGVTGSGKTEIYVRVIKSCLDAGKTAIILVPEISLTPQTYMFLRQRFDENIAVLHSGLSAGERFDEWMKIRRGDARIVMGARGAVFAPLENIGAIIIDEHHETSYKADNYPKYSAQEIAKQRCGTEDGILILGSATPDIETYYAAEQGEYTLLEMPERLFGLQLPRVQVVDMREELKNGNRGVISGPLYDLLKTTFDAGKQAMLFLNRRGYSTFVMCRSCGYAVQCEACDVTMTYHKTSGALKCHHCGRSKQVRKICPRCGKPHLKYFGMGTQQAEEQIISLFPGVRVIRMDMDNMSKKSAHLEAFERFSAGEADVLIGTQMITKGFDFDNVYASAVLAADTMLNLPDYHSAEYAFSQITQIAGRAGRKQRGRVVIQTYNPEHYAVRYAREHDYKGFYRHETAVRKMAQLPPFSTFVQIQFAGEKEQVVVHCVKDFITKLKTVLLPNKNVIMSIKASEAAIKRINNRERYQILINLKNGSGDVLGQIEKLFADAKYKDVLMGIDINPTELI